MAQTPDTGTVSSMSCDMQWMTLAEQEATAYSMLAEQARWRSLMKPGPSLSVVDLALLRSFGAVEWSTRLIWAEGLGGAAAGNPAASHIRLVIENGTDVGDNRENVAVPDRDFFLY